MNEEPQASGPTEIVDPRLRYEVKKAAIWIGMAALIALTVYLAGPLLLIAAGMVFAVLLDGGTRLLGRYLPIARGWRLMLVVVTFLGFLGWLGWYAGTRFAAEFFVLQDIVAAQIDRLLRLAAENGVMDELSAEAVSGQILGSVGRVTSILGTALGAMTAAILMIVIGVFVAAEPRLYDRGVAWMLPRASRTTFHQITANMGWALRRLLAGRLLGMLFEGVFTYIMLVVGAQLLGFDPIPLASLLALLTGILAFIPNLGALVSGLLMIAVGFGQGSSEGLFCVFVYLFVQNVDAYLVIPLIAKKTVDLAPALVLAMQIVMGTLFGILGLLLADPLLAAIKAALEEYSRIRDEDLTVEQEERIAPD